MTDAATEKAQAAHAGLEAPRTIVVVGGGQAAGWVVKTLRKEGFGGRLVMIADEVHLPYERPPLSKAVLAGEADIDTVRLVKPDDFDALNVEAWQPDCASSIDREQRIVRTQSGREVHYDRLVIATGGAARKLPDALVKTSHVTYLRTAARKQTRAGGGRRLDRPGSGGHRAQARRRRDRGGRRAASVCALAAADGVRLPARPASCEWGGRAPECVAREA
jgi:NADPH-dependent 2,4-dienoyl-CoA reductase/sulfur reductase-like enzyme